MYIYRINILSRWNNAVQFSPTHANWFLIIFKLNEFETKLNSVWFIIKRKTVTTIKFLPILNFKFFQIKIPSNFRLVHNQKENSLYDHIPSNLKWKRNTCLWVARYYDAWYLYRQRQRWPTPGRNNVVWSLVGILPTSLRQMSDTRFKSNL